MNTLSRALKNLFLRCLLVSFIFPAAIYGASADLSIPVHSHDPAQPASGDDINYFFTVHNNSTTDVADNITVTVSITGNQIYQSSASPYPFSDNGDGTFTANLGSLSAGGDDAFRIGFHVTGNGSISATATVSSPDDPNSTNNQATESATAGQLPMADLQVVSVTVVPNPAQVGDHRQYHGVIKNNGPNVATDVAVGIQSDSVDSLGNGFDSFETFVSAVPTPSPAGPDPSGNRFLPLGNIPANGTVTFDAFYDAAQQGTFTQFLPANLR